MSQIATRNDVNSKCKGSMSSGVDCPTKKQINNTTLVGVRGTYGDNECVKISDLVVGVKGKPIHVHVTVGISGGANLDTFEIYAGDTQMWKDTLWKSFDTHDWYTGNVCGFSNNSASARILIGWTNSKRTFTYSDDSSYSNSASWVGWGFDHSFGNYNQWLNEVKNIYITIGV